MWQVSAQLVARSAAAAAQPAGQPLGACSAPQPCSGTPSPRCCLHSHPSAGTRTQLRPPPCLLRSRSATCMHCLCHMNYLCGPSSSTVFVACNTRALCLACIVEQGGAFSWTCLQLLHCNETSKLGFGYLHSSCLALVYAITLAASRSVLVLRSQPLA